MRIKLSAIFSTLRPKQWVKNMLLCVAPFAAGGVGRQASWSILAISIITFSLASSVGYILNDLQDLEIDRLHPKKKFRALAAGLVTKQEGLTLAISLCAAIILLLSYLPSAFSFVILIYMVITSLYTYYWKNIPVIELFMVSSGFVLRLVAGAFACNLIISEWFLIVGGFGALFIVTTKRLAEWRHQEKRIVRIVLSFYTSDFLQSTISTAIAVCVTSYAFWAFNQTVNPIWYQISLIPFVMALIRYRWLAEKTIVEKPEDALFSDYPLLILGALNLISLVIAIY